MTKRDVRWLDPVEQTAWRGIVEVIGDVRAALDVELQQQHGLTEGDYGVLVVLSEAPGRRRRMCDLAARLHLSPSGLTRRIDGLVKLGLVAREPAADDRRVTLAVLTDAGFDRLERAAPDHVAGVRHHVFDHLTPSQVRHLAEILTAVRDAHTANDDRDRAIA